MHIQATIAIFAKDAITCSVPNVHATDAVEVRYAAASLAVQQRELEHCHQRARI